MENKYLQAQELLYSKLDETIEQWHVGNPGAWFPRYQHLCTFNMLKTHKNRKQCCREYIKKHPELKQIPPCDRCEYCGMFNYVAIDEEGKIAYISHPTQKELDERLDMGLKIFYNKEKEKIDEKTNSQT